MAKAPKPNTKPNKQLNKLLSYVRSGMDDLYNDTYYNTINNKRDLENIKDGLDQEINDILSNTTDSMGISSVTRMYTRMKLKDSQSDSTVNNAVIDLFNDPSLISSLMTMSSENRYLKEYDREIDMVCRYMPRLEEALDVKQDNVLSADNFAKDFINIINVPNKNNQAAFTDRITEIKKKYNLPLLFEEIYGNTSKYGEQFIYIVPYKQALEKLLRNKSGGISGSTPMGSLGLREVSIIENGAVSKSISNIDFDGKFNSLYSDDYKVKDLKLKLDRGGVLESTISSLKKVCDIRNKHQFSSIYESALNEYVNESKTIKKVIDDDLQFPDDIDRTSKDGLIDTKGSNNSFKVNVPGCVVKKLRRENVIPIYIEDICMGYYYIEFDNNQLFDYKNLNDPSMTMKSPVRTYLGGENDLDRDHLLKYLSGQMSKYIDANFINANQDLRKEIYMILKHNEVFNIDQYSNQIKVTFIPPEDIIHIKFKSDPNTHRGISDLDKALLPAKLYSCLYITNSIASMTRGQDKRVYYVKQNIETNISRTLLNVIEQIKKNNFGIRQIENINNILNITGRFNDYVIPLSASGDAPIQFEVMQGQNIDIKTDLMNILEELAVNATDVSLELLQSRQSIDYAVQAVMTNTKFLRKVFKRQSIVETYYSTILTRIYNCEYEENESIEMSLPAPAFLTMTNTNQLVENTVQYVNSIMEIELTDESDTVKALFKRKMLRHYLPSHVNINLIDKLKQQAKVEEALTTNNQGDE